MTKLKKCTKCGELKPLDEFYRNKRTADGRRYNCKKCSDEYSDEWIEKNRDKVRERERERYYRYRDADPEGFYAKKREANKRYREKYPEKSREVQRNYKRRHAEKYNEISKQWYEENKEHAKLLMRERARLKRNWYEKHGVEPGPELRKIHEEIESKRRKPSDA